MSERLLFGVLSEFVRKATIEAQDKMKDIRVVEPLIKALGIGDSDDWTSVYRAAELLGELKDPRAVEPLIKALGAKRIDVRRQVITALGKLKDSRAVEPLIKALGDSEDSIRNISSKALMEITNEDYGQEVDKWLDWWKNKSK